MKHNLQTVGATCFNYGCPREVANEILALRQELEGKISDLQNYYDKLAIPSSEGPKVRVQIDLIKEVLGMGVM